MPLTNGLHLRSVRDCIEEALSALEIHHTFHHMYFTHHEENRASVEDEINDHPDGQEAGAKAYCKRKADEWDHPMNEESYDNW